MGEIIVNRNIQHYVVRFCVAFALSGIFVGCASAVYYPEGYMGTVVEKDIGDNTFEVETTHEWAYTEWQSSNATTKWTFPNNDAADEVDIGDYVEILSFPEISGGVIGLGKMKSSTEKIITDIYGDPDFLEPYFQKPPDPPLSGGYTLKYDNTPNCSDCSERNCVADYTNVTIVNRTGHTGVDRHQLYPGQNYTHSGAEHRISITFHSGEAAAYPECTDRPCFSPQPISDFTVHLIHISAAENQPPVANFTHSPKHPIADEPVAFDASGSTDSDGDITDCRWDFGDGNMTTTSETIVTHSYTSKGDYNVNLTVTDDGGAEHSSNRTVTVTAAARGDLNHDGDITSADVVIVLGIAVRGEYAPGADMDENGCVNALDAHIILYMAAT
ncbi:MAG: PKD domain-containing protein [Euryarchaeota archaeon]|nr:PKD domain-containing protein [Euryarchaeota archaeon]